jgi:hypothetical protein
VVFDWQRLKEADPARLATGLMQGVIQEIVASHPFLFMDPSDTKRSVRQPSVLVDTMEKGGNVPPAEEGPQYLESSVPVAVVPYQTSR